jgi:hypothetical protein
MFFEREVAEQIRVFKARPEPEWPQIQNDLFKGHSKLSDLYRQLFRQAGSCRRDKA